MNIYKTTDTKGNLCTTCKQCLASCLPVVQKLGDAVGHDNVIACSLYDGEVRKDLSITVDEGYEDLE